MKGYDEVTVIVEGAVDSTEDFNRREDGTESRMLRAFIDKVEADSKTDGLATEVYVLHHGHGQSVEECSCSQFVTDGRPAYSWNVE